MRAFFFLIPASQYWQRTKVGTDIKKHIPYLFVLYWKPDFHVVSLHRATYSLKLQSSSATYLPLSEILSKRLERKMLPKWKHLQALKSLYKTTFFFKTKRAKVWLCNQNHWYWTLQRNYIRSLVPVLIGLVLEKLQKSATAFFYFHMIAI